MIDDSGTSEGVYGAARCVPGRGHSFEPALLDTLVDKYLESDEGSTTSFCRF
jgi:hypothetical protein